MAFSSKTLGKGALTSLEQLIEEINFQRAKEMRQILKDGELFLMFFQCSLCLIFMSNAQLTTQLHYK